MGKKNHAQGGKAAKSHTTFIDAAGPIVKFLDKSHLVKTYSLGTIITAKSKERRIKLVDEQGCLKLVVYGNTSTQDIRVYTSSPKAFKRALRENLGKEFNIQG